jgi:hypothetical protein
VRFSYENRRVHKNNFTGALTGLVSLLRAAAQLTGSFFEQFSRKFFALEGEETGGSRARQFDLTLP